MEMLDKIIALFVVFIVFKIGYSIVSKFFLKGVKLSRLIKNILDKFREIKSKKKE